MQVKYKINIFILLLCVLILINVGCKNKGGTSASTGKPASESSNNNAVSQLEQYDAPNLLSMGNSAIGEAMSEGIPEYSFNKALNYFYQVVTKFSDSYEAVEAQYNIAKYTEKKIKLLNMREIEIRKKQNVEKSLEFEELKPFLQSYIPAINEYIKLYNNKKIWSKFSGENLKKSRQFCNDALLQAAKLLSDETNPKPDYNRAIELYKIIIDEFADSNYGDFALYSIVSIYYNQNNWNKVIEYAKLMETNFSQSQYWLEVDLKAKKSRSLLK